MRNNIGDKVTFELFDLDRDIGELNNIAAEYPKISEEIERIMDQESE